MPFYPCPRERSAACGSANSRTKNPFAWVSVVRSLFCCSLPPRPETHAKGFFLLDYTALGNESNSDASGKRYWWLRSETAHRWTAKLASMTERLTNVAAPESSN